MSASTYEGIVENGRIRLRGDVSLPENTRVYVVIAEGIGAPHAHLRTPRLAHPEQTGDFAKQVIQVRPDA